MSQEQGVVQPLETAGRGALDRLIGGNNAAPATQGYTEPVAPEVMAANATECPNCKAGAQNGESKSVKLSDTGVCPECGFDKRERLF